MLLDDYIKYGIPIIERIGYIKHPHIKAINLNNYLLTLNDSYINVLMDVYASKDVIHFQRCFYNDPNYKKLINEYFDNVQDFITFVNKYHIKSIRLQKLKKIHEKR